MFINGYKYTTESSAKSAQKACNDYYGLPDSPNDVTRNWVDYQCAELNEPNFWFIMYDHSLFPILGEPTEFEFINPIE